MSKRQIQLPAVPGCNAQFLCKESCQYFNGARRVCRYELRGGPLCLPVREGRPCYPVAFESIKDVELAYDYEVVKIQPQPGQDGWTICTGEVLPWAVKVAAKEQLDTSSSAWYCYRLRPKKGETGEPR